MGKGEEGIGGGHQQSYASVVLMDVQSPFNIVLRHNDHTLTTPRPTTNYRYSPKKEERRERREGKGGRDEKREERSDRRKRNGKKGAKRDERAMKRRQRRESRKEKGGKKRRPRASNGQRYPLPCRTHFGNLKCARQGKGYC